MSGAGLPVLFRQSSACWLLSFNPIKHYIQRKREERKKLKEERLKAEQAARDDAAAFRKEMRDAMAHIDKTLVTLTDDIGDLQYERLSRRRVYTAQGWCPGSKRKCSARCTRATEQKAGTIFPNTTRKKFSSWTASRATSRLEKRKHLRF